MFVCPPKDAVFTKNWWFIVLFSRPASSQERGLVRQQRQPHFSSQYTFPTYISLGLSTISEFVSWSQNSCLEKCKAIHSDISFSVQTLKTALSGARSISYPFRRNNRPNCRANTQSNCFKTSFNLWWPRHEEKNPVDLSMTLFNC